MRTTDVYCATTEAVFSCMAMTEPQGGSDIDRLTENCVKGIMNGVMRVSRRFSLDMKRLHSRVGMR